jgi:transposase
LTPRRWQSSSSIDLQGHISKQGDTDVRRYLYEAALVLLARVQGFSTLKAWGLKVARSKGHARAGASWRSSCLRCGATAQSIAGPPIDG